MSDCEKRMSLLCVQILDVIENIRGWVGDVGEEQVGGRLLKESSRSVLSVLKSLSTLSEENLVFYEKYEKEVKSALVMMYDILVKCRDRVPNHFGIYEVEHIYYMNVYFISCCSLFTLLLIIAQSI